nr:MAG TPA: helix-turn-helix domain protein [Caudoviricetes sp.]
MSDRILAIINSLDISKSEFANALKVTPAYISKLINKGTIPSDRLIDDICEKYKVNEEWLRTGKGEMFKNEDKDFGAICAEIGANDENAKNALLKYAELTPEDKKLFWDFVEKFLK